MGHRQPDGRVRRTQVVQRPGQGPVRPPARLSRADADAFRTRRGGRGTPDGDLEDGVVKEGSVDFVFGLMDKGMQVLARAARDAHPRPHDPGFSSGAFDYDKLTLGEFLAGVEMNQLERDMTSSFWAAACQAPLDEAGLTLALRWLSLAGWDWQLMVDVISRYKIVGGTGLLVDGIKSDTRGDFRTGTKAVRVVESKRSCPGHPRRRLDPAGERGRMCRPGQRPL